MPFSVEQFRERANTPGYFVPDMWGGGYRVATLHEWKDREPRWQRSASNRARQAFVESLAREFGREIADELQMLLPAEGTPLSSRTVKDIIKFGKIRQAEAAHKQEIEAPINDLEGNFDFNSRARPDQVPHGGLPPRELEELVEQEVDYEPDPATKSGKGKEREDAVPVADPPPQELWVSMDPKVQRQGGRREPPASA
jgi:hypothetical protein